MQLLKLARETAVQSGRSLFVAEMADRESFLYYVYGVFLVGSTSTHSVLVKSAIYSIFIL